MAAAFKVPAGLDPIAGQNTCEILMMDIFWFPVRFNAIQYNPAGYCSFEWNNLCPNLNLGLCLN